MANKRRPKKKYSCDADIKLWITFEGVEAKNSDKARQKVMKIIRKLAKFEGQAGEIKFEGKMEDALRVSVWRDNGKG